MNFYQKKLLEIVKENLPTYRQVRYRFYEDHLAFMKIIEVQFVNIGRDEKSVTIYFGIYVPRVAEILWSETKKKDTEIGDCVFMCNINDIVQNFKGKPKIKYWELNALKKNSFSEIEIGIRDHLYTFSKKFDSLEAVNSFINETNYPLKNFSVYPVHVLALKHLLGKNDEAKKLLVELQSNDAAYFNPYIDKMNKSLEKHGLKPIIL